MMSASTGGSRGQFVVLPPTGQSAAEAGFPEQLEGLISTARALEQSLGQERGRTRKIEGELWDAHALYDRLLREERGRTAEQEIQISKLKAAGARIEEDAREFQRKAQEQYGTLGAEFTKVRAELTQYRAAWAGVLQRERDAKMVLADSERRTERLTELENRARKQDDALAAERETRREAEMEVARLQDELRKAGRDLEQEQRRIEAIEQRLDQELRRR